VSTGLSALLLKPRDELVQFQQWLIRELVIHSSKLHDWGVHQRYQQQGDVSQNGAIVVHESAVPVVIARRLFERHGEILKVLKRV
jgi:hypothetical protein